MLPLMSKVAASLLLSASTLINPTMPNGLSFDASAYVTAKNEIRVAVEKPVNTPVTIVLRNKDNQVLYRQTINQKDSKYALKLNIDELGDGLYELEVKSSEGSIRKQLNVATQPVREVSRTIVMQ
ncbi:hypothetical protein [Spirosoma sp.]|uniref:hypothetical protein n=1 Tax=Spirosoma sp. TaxID=1899569 RepID=UPI003B3BCF33